MKAKSTPDVTDGPGTPNGGSLHPVIVLQWQYSRNQLRYEVCDGEVYKHGRDFFQLFEIRSNRNPYQIRQATDTHRLLHKGKKVAESKSVKTLKETAAKLHNNNVSHGGPLTHELTRSVIPPFAAPLG